MRGADRVKEALFPADDAAKTPVLFLVPGNPGLVRFYHTFLGSLHAHLGQRHLALCVSHAGHVEAGNVAATGLYSLEQQIEHKLAILDRLPAGTPVVLLGHSIGAYMCLEIARRRPQMRIERVFALFPTVRSLNDGLSPVVRWMMLPQVRYLSSLAVGLLPRAFFGLLMGVRHYLGFDSKYDADARRLIMNEMLTEGVMHNILYLVYTEAKYVRELDREQIAASRDKTTYIYGLTDQYTPHAFVDEMRTLVPPAQVLWADEGVNHAFCLEHSLQVARQVAGLMHEHGA